MGNGEVNEHTSRIVVQLNACDSELQSGSHGRGTLKTAKNDKMKFHRHLKDRRYKSTPVGYQDSRAHPGEFEKPMSQSYTLSVMCDIAGTPPTMFVAPCGDAILIPWHRGRVRCVTVLQTEQLLNRTEWKSLADCRLGPKP